MAAVDAGRRGVRQDARFTADIEVVRLVELAADQLDVTLDYGPNQVRGSVTLRGDEPLSSRELWRLANDSLESRGLTTLLRPGVDGASGTYEIVSLSRASESLVWVPTDLLWEDPDAPEPGYRVAVYKAQHIEASKLVQALSPILPQASGSVRLLGETDTIAIVGLSSRIRSLKPIIERIDVPGEPLVIEEARLEHRTATELLASIETIRQRQTALGGAPFEGELSAGSDTKSVLILCPQENVQEWTTLIRRVDRRCSRPCMPASWIRKFVSAVHAPSHASSEGTELPRLTVLQHRLIQREYYDEPLCTLDLLLPLLETQLVS